MKYAVGVDLGGTTVKIGIFTEDAQIVSKWEIKTRKEENGKYILSDIAASVLENLTKNGIDKADVTGLGMGVPGAVQPDGSVHSCVNLGWGRVMVKEEMERLTGFPVYPANDANIAALGEAWQGGGKGCSNTVMVTLGTGVGGGIIVNGKIVVGTSGFGGEIGHMKMNMHETETCGCGKKGCLEQYTSATGIVTMAKRKLKEETRPTILRDIEEITAKDIFDAAKEEDVVASELVDKLCCILGKSIAGIACVVDPDVIIIGGGVSRAGDILIGGVKKYFLQYAFFAHREIKIVLATLGNDAGIYGCVGQLL